MKPYLNIIRGLFILGRPNRVHMKVLPACQGVSSLSTPVARVREVRSSVQCVVEVDLAALPEEWFTDFREMCRVMWREELLMWKETFWLPNDWWFLNQQIKLQRYDFSFCWIGHGCFFEMCPGRSTDNSTIKLIKEISVRPRDDTKRLPPRHRRWKINIRVRLRSRRYFRDQNGRRIQTVTTDRWSAFLMPTNAKFKAPSPHRPSRNGAHGEEEITGQDNHLKDHHPQEEN